MQGSFILASMLGNTGYLGYPVALALVGAKYFAWALLYDLLGTMIGSYGIGVMIASRFSSSKLYQTQLPWQIWLEPLKKTCDLEFYIWPQFQTSCAARTDR